ncbi:hypothetical protein Srut_39540 [Streptomyces rutgersensis]|uniref:hypothetical protein n=1 Tax=Streptomyces rutgersensis TaxID=53451 RepID=UPI0013C9FDD3|nr:hypothetical protein [Streptomyces rutgersensis]GFH67440.1 hypothetical protein Srut_39540 [Streptomyces rutgersensis]
MVVFGMPKDLAADVGSELGKLSTMRHRRDLGQADRVLDTDDTQEDAEGLATDDFAGHLGPYRKRLTRCRPGGLGPRADLKADV